MSRATALLAVALIACARPHVSTSPVPPDPRPAPAASSAPFDPHAAGVITLLSIDLPAAGTIIGGHYQGAQFTRETGSMEMADGTRDRWMRTTRDAGDSILIAAGFRVQRPGERSSDAERLRGVRFALTGQVSALTVRTIGYVEPFDVEASVRVDWELLDLAAGTSVFEGASGASVRGADSLDIAVNRALAAAVSRLVGQPEFRRAITAPRPLYAQDLLAADFARAMPGPADTLDLPAHAQNMSPENGILGGVVVLLGTHNFSAPAVVISRDGLALTTAAAGQRRWLWAKLFDNRNRAVRVIRVSGAVALVELSCVEDCETVKWEPDTTLRDHARILQVGGRSVLQNTAMGVTYSWRSLKVRREADGALTWSARGRPKLAGGEAIARADGIVVGIGTGTGIVPVGEALRLLGVRIESSTVVAGSRERP